MRGHRWFDCDSDGSGDADLCFSQTSESPWATRGTCRSLIGLVILTPHATAKQTRSAQFDLMLLLLQFLMVLLITVMRRQIA